MKRFFLTSYIIFALLGSIVGVVHLFGGASTTMFISSTGGGAGPTYIHDVVCDDDAANTTVSNDGTSNDWSSNFNTSTIHSTTAPSGYSDSFLLDASWDYIRSPDNWTDETLIVEFYVRHNNATAGTEYHWQIGDNDAAAEANELVLMRSGSDEWTLCAGSGSQCQNTTDYNPSADTWYHIKLTIDCSQNPYTVTMLVDDTTTLTWSGSFAYSALTLSAPVSYGYDGSSNPDSYIAGLKMYSSD